MKLSDLRDGMRRVDVDGDVIEVGEARTVNLKTGDQARTAEVHIRDSTGDATVSLWDDQIDQVAKGGHVRITNGYTNSFRGQLRVNVGKFGNLDFIEEAMTAKPAPKQTTLSSSLTEQRIREIVGEELKGYGLI